MAAQRSFCVMIQGWGVQHRCPANAALAVAGAEHCRGQVRMGRLQEREQKEVVKAQGVQRLRWLALSITEGRCARTGAKTHA
eukprot:1145957-Pelagomonas_calceolata.AAC.1